MATLTHKVCLIWSREWLRIALACWVRRKVARRWLNEVRPIVIGTIIAYLLIHHQLLLVLLSFQSTFLAFIRIFCVAVSRSSVMRERVLTKHALHDWLLIRILSRAMHHGLLLLLATDLFIVLHECLDHKRYIFRIRVHLHGTLKFGCNLWVLLSHILQLRKRQYLCNNRVHLARLLLLLLLHLLRWLL